MHVTHELYASCIIHSSSKLLIEKEESVIRTKMPLGGSQKSQREPGSPVRAPIILAKNEKQSSLVTEGRPAVATPNRLWKPESDRSTSSPKHGIPSSLQSGELPHVQPYKIQQRSDLRGAGGDWTKTFLPPEAIKVVDAYMSWSHDALMEFLLEQSEYRVVGVLGGDGVGKTYLMSLLASHPREQKSPFEPRERRSNGDVAGHSTTGINVYITNERTILLDCQPLFSSSVLNDIISNDRRYDTDYNNTEDICDSVNLQLIMFLLAVCHIVLVVENEFTDPNIHRALQTVEMLKPPQISNEKLDDHNEFTGKIVFVQNMYSSSDISPMKISKMESTLSRLYSKSNLNIHRKALGGEVKLVVMTMCSADEKDQEVKAINKHHEQQFVQELLTLPVSPIFNHASLSEKNWLQYANKMWEAVKKYPFLAEYMRLLTSY